VAPKLAEIEVEEVTSEGQRGYVIRRKGMAPNEGALLSAEGLAIADYFNGRLDLRAIQKAVYNRYGHLLYVERIHELANALLKAGLIDVPGAVSQVDRASLRPPVFAGEAYDSDPETLRAILDSYFTMENGPGSAPKANAPAGDLLGIVAPHIDPHRGGPLYAHAYKSLVEGTDADLFVVFGTAHSSPEQLFTLTRRSYDTPLGPVTTDRDALAVLEQELGSDIFENESVHDEEHSIEFQALFLRHLFDKRAISMLPVLCSSLYGCVAEGRRPDSDPAVGRFLRALELATAGRKVAYIAAADLSHVGRTYGDALAPNDAWLKELAQRDLQSLRHFESGNADAFFDHVGPDGASRRICGLTPIYMLMRATGNARGKLLKYSQWHGTDEGSAVTFAAAAVEA
jgi:AmmeMemoRadiSam system protein B